MKRYFKLWDLKEKKWVPHGFDFDEVLEIDWFTSPSENEGVFFISFKNLNDNQRYEIREVY